MRNLVIGLFVAVGFFFGTVSAAAADRPISWKHEVGDRYVEVVFTSHAELTHIEAVATNLRTKRSSTFSKRALQDGEHWRVRLRKPSVQTDYRVEFKGRVDDQQFNGHYNFSVGEEPPPDFTVQHAKFEGTKSELRLVPDRAVTQVRLVARGERGQTIVEFERQVNARAGSVVNLDFESPERVLDVDVTMSTTSGAHRSYRYTPWSFETESSGLNFETGSATIHESDIQKLNTVYAEIQDAVKSVGKHVDLKLYIGGYTDTVGSSSSNEALSKQRATSIARFMKAKGVSVPIYIQGFGERVLAVQTRDNVANAANRRAVFIVRANTPPRSELFPSSRWERVH